MNTVIKAALAAVLVAGAGQAAQADLTYQGAVGLPLNPTAQIPAPGGVRIQGSYLDFDNDVKDYGIHAAGRIADRFEINGGFSKLDTNGGPNDDSGFNIGAKYLITRESDPAGVRLAVGAGYDRALLRNTYVYLVGSKYLGAINGDRTPITGHLGLRYDRFDPSGGAADSSKVSVYGGVEVPITRTGDFSLVGEIQSENNEYAGTDFPFSASVRFRPAGEGYSASVGVQRQGLGDTGFFAQLGYTFDTGR